MIKHNVATHKRLKYNIRDMVFSKYYIYCIIHNNKPIYVGSTNDLNKREHKHNKRLEKRRNLYKRLNYKPSPNDLYTYFIHHNIKNIKLKKIKEDFNKLIEIKNNNFEEKRYLDEDKHINHLIKKGFDLCNLIFASDFDLEGNELTFENKKKWLTDSKRKEHNHIRVVNHLKKIELEKRTKFKIKESDIKNILNSN